MQVNLFRKHGVEIGASIATATVVILAILFLPFPRTPVPALSALALNRDTHYSIDTVTYGKVVTKLSWHPQPDVSLARNQAVIFDGWAADDASAHGLPALIDAIVDGGQSVTAIKGLSRPDVAALYHDPVLAASGFEATLPACSLAVGQHRIEFRFEAANGSGYYRSRDDVDLRILAPRPQLPKIRFSIRPIAPAMTEAGRHVAIGWLVDEATCGPVAGVRIEIDGRAVAVALYGNARPDVAAALGVAQYANSGFDAEWADTSLPRGAHVLQLVAVLANGRTADSGYRLAFNR